MNNVKLNGKITIDNGKRAYFRVVRNIRNENGKPTSLLIKTLASAPVNVLNENSFQIATLAKINEELTKLKSKGKISAQNFQKVKAEFDEKIKKRFSAVSPRSSEKFALEANLLARYPILKP
jgi:hypothetical protein